MTLCVSQKLLFFRVSCTTCRYWCRLWLHTYNFDTFCCNWTELTCGPTPALLSAFERTMFTNDPRKVQTCLYGSVSRITADITGLVQNWLPWKECMSAVHLPKQTIRFAAQKRFRAFQRYPGTFGASVQQKDVDCCFFFSWKSQDARRCKLCPNCRFRHHQIVNRKLPACQMINEFCSSRF